MKKIPLCCVLSASAVNTVFDYWKKTEQIKEYIY